jgi:hypothetical protein
LLELTLAVSLSGLVLIGLFSLMVPLVRSQVASAQGQTVQLNLSGARSVVARELRQATFLSAPAPAGTTTAKLEGCSNAAVPPGGAAPAPIDATAPMHWFAFCSDSSRLYYHAGSGSCPPVYVCGVSPTAVFGGGADSAVSAGFIRLSALTTAVTASLSVTSGGQTSSVSDTISYSAAAGTNQ